MLATWNLLEREKAIKLFYQSSNYGSSSEKQQTNAQAHKPTTSHRPSKSLGLQVKNLVSRKSLVTFVMVKEVKTVLKGIPV